MLYETCATCLGVFALQQELSRKAAEPKSKRKQVIENLASVTPIGQGIASWIFNT